MDNTPDPESKVQGLTTGDQGLGSRAQGPGTHSPGFRAQNLGTRARGRFYGSGFRARTQSMVSMDQYPRSMGQVMDPAG